MNLDTRTMIDTKYLKKVAQAASDDFAQYNTAGHIIANQGVLDVAARFIATASPDVILELIQTIETLGKNLARVKMSCNCECNPCEHCEPNNERLL